MASPVFIRKATVADVDILCSLSHSIWPKVYTEMISKEQIAYMLSLMYSKEVLTKQISEEGVTFLLAETSLPVGFAGFGPSKNQRFKLHKLYVEPEAQGLGIGRKLVETMIAQLPSTCCGIELQVNKRNRAQTFYSKLGFDVEQEAVFDIGQGFVMDDYIMFKSLM
jgi:diamine N-acetyltransferase